ncbi:Metallo-hydrolase/oxidoreductase [Hortaea werneckii]|nr:Metallo-hydrolase/oxidoreductase [Hortaea werneckii]
MTEAHLCPPKQPPALNIPHSNSTVKVSCIDSTTRLKLPMQPFLQPDFTGHPDLLGPAFSFLIEHPSRKPILFDLAVRKDWHVLPSAPKWKELGWTIKVDQDIATILKENGVDVDGGAIESIIWSHHHWDHVGDPSTFPPTTELVVGPGFKGAYLPGYPTRKEATLMDSDFEGREVREVRFDEDEGFKIGRFNALDFFGDGSFYLLDTPGHSVGHICGLARTSAKPDTFVFLGGDASHHGGEFRPTEYLPLPRALDPSPLRSRAPVCPGHLLQDVHPSKTADKPFYVLTENFAHNREVANWTIDGLGEFDAHENVPMLMAHDDAVVDPAQLDFYPAALNDWYKQGIKGKVRWLFLEDFEGALVANAAGEKPSSWASRA